MRLPAQEIEVEHWPNFEGEIHRLTSIPEDNEAQTSPPLHPWLFRGLGNSCWGLETTLERSHDWSENTLSLQNYYSKIWAARPAVETFSGRRWKIPEPPKFKELFKDDQYFSPDMILTAQPELYEYLVYLRHHGFPSPLLDWTASPYVAAFFAFDVVPKSAESVRVYAVLPRLPGDLALHFVGPLMRTHERHFLQQCWYSWCAENTGDYPFRPQELAMTANPGLLGPVDRIVKFTIPAKERRAALQHLDLMNINPFSLFGSEDSMVRTIARRECFFENWR